MDMDAYIHASLTHTWQKIPTCYVGFATDAKTEQAKHWLAKQVIQFAQDYFKDDLKVVGIGFQENIASTQPVTPVPSTNLSELMLIHYKISPNLNSKESAKCDNSFKELLKDYLQNQIRKSPDIKHEKPTDQGYFSITTGADISEYRGI